MSIYLVRAWLVRSDTPDTIMSLVTAAGWPVDDWLTAVHSRSLDELRHGEPVPRFTCTCGIYGVTAGSDNEAWTRILGNTRMVSPSYLLGVVEMAGRVIVHQYGARAERAKIAALSLQVPDWPQPRVVPTSPEWARRTLALPEMPLDPATWWRVSRGLQAEHREQVAALNLPIPTFPTTEAMLAEYPVTDLSTL